MMVMVVVVVVVVVAVTGDGDDDGDSDDDRCHFLHLLEPLIIKFSQMTGAVEHSS